jgi:hypothetical protein
MPIIIIHPIIIPLTLLHQSTDIDILKAPSRFFLWRSSSSLLSSPDERRWR